MTDLFATTPRAALPPGLIAPPFPEYSATSREAHLVPYEDRHAEIARELAVRREGWPRLVDTDRLSADDARRQVEAIEAVHHDYWSALWLWDGPAGEPGRDLIRGHIAALDTLQQKEAA